MVRIAILKKPALKLAATTVARRAQQLLQDIWKEVKDFTLQWETPGSGEADVRPEIPEKLKEMTLNEKLSILKNGAPPDFEVSDMARFLVATCINYEMSVLYGRFSTARKYASEQARKAWNQINSSNWGQGMQEKKVKALAMQICKPHAWEAHFIAENQELTKTQSNTTKKAYVFRRVVQEARQGGSRLAH